MASVDWICKYWPTFWGLNFGLEDRIGDNALTEIDRELRKVCWTEPLVVTMCNSFSEIGVLGLGLLVDGDVGIGVLPQMQESLVRFPRGGFIAHHLLRAA